MQVSPLLSSEISGYDLNDEVKNENYNKEISNLFNEIMEDLNKADINNNGYLSEEELLDYLQKKVPHGQQLNVPLFQKFLQDIDRNIDMNIDLNDFCKKYIQTHEELKLNYETLQKGLDKEKNQKISIESKIQEVKQEKLNTNNISPNACVSTLIGKITFLAHINYDLVYFIVSLDDKEKITSTKNIENANFVEKLTFPIQDKQSTLSYKLFASNTNQFISSTDVPLCMINTDNEEIILEFELKDENNMVVAVFRPKIIVVTSYYDMYQKKYEYIDKNIESYQNKILDLKQNLDDISLPYQKIFDKSEQRLLKGPESSNSETQGQLVKGVEGVLKNFFKDKKVKWVVTLKLILYFNIFILLFSTLVKPDFISLFICLILLLFINTEKTNYFFEQFDKIFIGLLTMIAYDIFDFLFLRKNKFDVMSTVDGWGKFFGFLGFLGKCALLLGSFIIKKKYGKTGIIYE